MQWIFYAIPVIIVVVLALMGYVKAPPDTAYIISGPQAPYPHR